MGGWVELPVEGLLTDVAGTVGSGGQGAGLVGVAGEGLLEQHVLAGVERLGCPLAVHAVGQRNVDGIDIGVLKQLLIGGVGFGEAVLLGVCAGVLVAA